MLLRYHHQHDAPRNITFPYPNDLEMARFVLKNNN